MTTRSETVPTPRSGLAASSYLFTAVMIGTTLPTPLYPAYQRAFGFGGSTTTQLFAVYAVGVIVALLVAGRFSDVVGRKPVLLAGLGFSAASAVLFTVGAPLELLFVARVLSGFSAGLLTSTGTVTVLESAPADRARLHSAAATAANIGGLGLGMLVSGLVAQWSPWPTRAPYVVDLVLLLVAGAAWLRLRETVTVESGARPTVRAPRVPAGTRGVFAVACVGGVAGFAVCGLFSSVAPNFVAQVLGIPGPAVVGVVTSVLFLASALAQIGLADLDVVPAVRLGYTLLVVGMVLLVAALRLPSLPVLVASSVIAGAGQGLLFTKGLRALTAAAPPARRTETTTAYFVVAYLAISAPVVAVGLAARSVGLTAAGTGYAAVVVALALVGLSVAGRLRPRG